MYVCIKFYIYRAGNKIRNVISNFTSSCENLFNLFSSDEKFLHMLRIIF